MRTLPSCFPSPPPPAHFSCCHVCLVPLEMNQVQSGLRSSKSSQRNMQENMSIFIIHGVGGTLWADLSTEDQHQRRSSRGRVSRRLCKRLVTLLPGHVKWTQCRAQEGRPSPEPGWTLNDPKSPGTCHKHPVPHVS